MKCVQIQNGKAVPVEKAIKPTHPNNPVIRFESGVEPVDLTRLGHVIAYMTGLKYGYAPIETRKIFAGYGEPKQRVVVKTELALNGHDKQLGQGRKHHVDSIIKTWAIARGHGTPEIQWTEASPEEKKPRKKPKQTAKPKKEATK